MGYKCKEFIIECLWVLSLYSGLWKKSSTTIRSVLEGKLPSLEPKTTLKLVADNLKALHVARDAFIKSEASEKIKRALKHNICTSNDNKFFSGGKIYFKGEVNQDGVARVQCLAKMVNRYWSNLEVATFVFILAKQCSFQMRTIIHW